jgi:hypothetical protein
LLVALGCDGGDAPDAPEPAEQQAQTVTAARPSVVRIHVSSRDELNALAGEMAPWEVHQDQGYAVFEVDGQAEIDELRTLGYRVEVDHALTAQRRAPPPDDIGLMGIPGYSCYRTVEETYAAAAARPAKNPTQATWSENVHSRN